MVGPRRSGDNKRPRNALDTDADSDASHDEQSYVDQSCGKGAPRQRKKRRVDHARTPVVRTLAMEGNVTHMSDTGSHVRILDRLNAITLINRSWCYLGTAVY